MATIKVDNQTFEVEDGTRLVLALEEGGVDILHLCGGNARCTTCRVEFAEGEPSAMTAAERNILDKKELAGVARLSCQIQCEATMEVRPMMRVSTSDFDEPGAIPASAITPDPEWI
ncbi:MAG: 2Fe-2S iron-sulfur cluster-binding protein [Acidimicrobiia bacterium]|nr:2Fe-2S iron-sulfur cluster-binding protein [Acidimicrobiia bacterium]MDX2466540.1 2Fe-2S iron-sulfur cluster-binding protein [Acidimicrobiia bacterium]